MDKNYTNINLDSLCEAVFSAATEGILMADQFGVILQANAACHQLFGYQMGEMNGKSIEALMPIKVRDRHVGHRDGFFARPTPRPMGKDLDLQGQRKDGSAFFIEISLSHAKVDIGPVAIAFISDISYRKEREQELQATMNKYNAVIKNAVDGIIVIDEQGIIEMVNPAVVELFGYTADELEGEPINKLMPKPESEQHGSYIERYKKTGNKRIIGIGREVKGLKKSGKTFPVNLSVSEVELGNRLIYTGLIHDLSQQRAYEQQLKEYSEGLEQKVKERTVELEELNTFLEEQMEALMQAQDTVRRSENMYKLIAQNFPNGTINVFDRELRYVFVEGKELFELGITSEKLIGTRFVDRLNSSIAPIAERELMEVFKGEPRSFEITFQNSYYVLNAVPLIEDNGEEIQQILVVERNITRQKKADEDIRKALEKEQQLGELKSRFVTMASHEFRTPLSTIASSATLIGKYAQEEQQQKRDKHIQRIQSNVKHLTNILNDFLSLGKLEEGQVGNEPQNCDLPAFCADLCEEMETVFLKSQSIDYVHKGNPIAYIDSKLLRNVLINLLSNAIKYSKEGQVIYLETEVSEHCTSVIVRDEGIGIPSEDLPHLFTRFFRATNTGNIQGTGMGLNIVKKYLDLMGGRIEVDSQMGQGTSFLLYFDKS